MKRFKPLGTSDLLERPITKIVVPRDRHMSRICVGGYDTSLYEYDLNLALRKHFSSCGEILHIYVPRNFEKGILERSAFIRLAGEGTLENGMLYLKNTSVQNAVMGYDTSLPEIDLQIGLSKHFSSCGEVTDVSILPNVGRAIIYIRGDGAAEKALELSGRDVGGWNITVVSVMPPWDSEQNFPTSNRASPMMKAMIMEAKMRRKNKITAE